MSAPADRASIVVVDDDTALLTAWRSVLESEYDVVCFSRPLVAKEYIRSNDFDIAILDLQMPEMDGLQLLAYLREVRPNVESIMATGQGTIEVAVSAMKLGAYDFFCKPIKDMSSVLRAIEHALERRNLRLTNERLEARVQALGPNREIVGDSPAIVEMRRLTQRLAALDSPVLITGESGTGKELVARALHHLGPRSSGKFLPVNCAAISESLIDSELFGHEKGAFTGAVGRRKGFFEAAEGGVLFLDEIGDMPQGTQVRLLRVLQEGEVRPVGSNETKKVDVRVVLATNVNLEQAVSRDDFRQDLYYRINTFQVQIPPLRQRREDIPLLAHHFLHKIAKQLDLPVDGFTDEALGVLAQHSWPGNVRELHNVVEYSVSLCTSEKVGVGDLPRALQDGPRSAPPAGSAGSAGTPGVVDGAGSYFEARERAIRDFERSYVEELISRAKGNISEAARSSGLDRSHLRKLLRRFDLDPEAFRSAQGE